MPELSCPLDVFITEKAIERSMISMHPKIPSFVKRHLNPISLGLGEPFHEFQPVTSIAVRPRTENLENFIIPKTLLNKGDICISESLRYGIMQGLTGLWDNMRQFIVDVGNEPSFQNWGIHPTFGRNNGFHRLVETFLERGDVILVEEFTSFEFLEQISNVGAIAVPMKSDPITGIDFDHLFELLTNWNTIYPAFAKPKILYTMPSGLDPTGYTQPFYIKQKIYKLCDANNILILEDEPYSYISLNPISDEKEYLESLIPSYQTIDTIGRVIRIETFSKNFAPGLRLGFIVAHTKFINLLEIFSEIINDFPPGPAQLLVNNTVASLGGWIPWLLQLSNKYLERKSKAMGMLSHHCKKFEIIAEPQFGMFVSIRPKVSNIQDFIDKALSQRLTLDTFNSNLNEEFGIIRISLCQGDDQDFNEALERLSRIM